MFRMSDFKPIETQEELDRVMKDRLNRQKEKFDKDLAELEQLRQRNSELETENGSLKSAMEETTNSTADYEKTIADLNEKVAGYETANLRTRVALQHGLPFDLADRLVGTDEESLKADAERLAGFVKKDDFVPPQKSVEEPTVDGEDSAYKNLIQNLDLEGE